MAKVTKAQLDRIKLETTLAVIAAVLLGLFIMPAMISSKSSINVLTGILMLVAVGGWLISILRRMYHISKGE